MGIVNKKKGDIAENLFAEYLNNQSIPFYRVDQRRETYSEKLNNENIRRPDYIIHTKKRIFYVDVKYREKKDFGNQEERFYLNQNEIKTLFNFHDKLSPDIWIAFTCNLDSPKFYFAPILEIYEYYDNILKLIEETSFIEEFNMLFLDEQGDKTRDKCFVYIPETLLYEQLSYENGFFKDVNKEFLETEAKYHKYNWIEFVDS